MNGDETPPNQAQRITARRENPLYDARLALSSDRELHVRKAGADAATKQRIDFELIHRGLSQGKTYGPN
jgi:hypothetical protein